MKQLLTLYFIILMSACAQTKLSSDLIILNDTAYIKNKSTPFSGPVKNLYTNGNKKFKGTYINGKRDGIWYGWYKNGAQKFIHNYKDGKRFGEQLEFDKNGKLLEGSSTTYYQM